MTSRCAVRPWRIVAVALVVMSSAALAANWYAQRVSLPRYCEAPGQTLQRLQRILTEERPAGDGERRPYIVAAKLLFLLPRQAGEGLAPYLDRIGRYLRENC